MAQYIFKCPECDNTLEKQDRLPFPQCPVHWLYMKRAYSLEGVGFAVNGLMKRRDAGVETNRDAARLFLETAEEAAGPGDPDGAKAIKQWNERYIPAEGNTNPIRPERPLHAKEVF